MLDFPAKPMYKIWTILNKFQDNKRSPISLNFTTIRFYWPQIPCQSFCLALEILQSRFTIKNQFCQTKGLTYQPNALPNPGTMVIKPFHTVITNWAVRTSRRPVEHASITILDLNSNSIDLNLLNSRQPQLRSLTSPNI